MTEVAVNSPQKVRVVMVGNIEFLEYLKKEVRKRNFNQLYYRK